MSDERPALGLGRSLNVPEHECAAAGTGCPACAQTLAQPYPAAGPRARQVEWLAAVYEVPVCLIEHDWGAVEYVAPPPIAPAGSFGIYRRTCQRVECGHVAVRSSRIYGPEEPW